MPIGMAGERASRAGIVVVTAVAIEINTVMMCTIEMGIERSRM
jgi:hypothetical protein